LRLPGLVPCGTALPPVRSVPETAVDPKAAVLAPEAITPASAAVSGAVALPKSIF